MDTNNCSFKVRTKKGLSPVLEVISHNTNGTVVVRSEEGTHTVLISDLVQVW